MAKFRRNGKLKKFVAGALAVVLGVGAVMGVSSLIGNKSDDDGKVKVNPSYSIGGLDDQGKYVESDATLYTKDAFECQGLSIKPKFDSNVEYQIFFYDEVGQFVESTGVLATTYDDKVPFSASRARLEITPVWAEDVKEDEQVIKWYNKYQFESSLEIKVNKEQVVEMLSENLYSYFGYGALADDGSLSTGSQHIVKVDVSSYDKIYLKLPQSAIEGIYCGFIDVDGKAYHTAKVLIDENLVKSTSDYVLYAFDTTTYNELRVLTSSKVVFDVYGVL